MEENVDAECEAKEEIGKLQIADAPENFPTLFGGNRHGLCHKSPPDSFLLPNDIARAREFHILGRRWQPARLSLRAGRFMRERRFGSPDETTLGNAGRRTQAGDSMFT